jgi:hypothetical protein
MINQQCKKWKWQHPDKKELTTHEHRNEHKNDKKEHEKNETLQAGAHVCNFQIRPLEEQEET